jgi:hypothetical protein
VTKSTYPWAGKGSRWARKRQWLKTVARTPERDLRGHRITLTYHTLGIDLFTWIYDLSEKKPFEREAFVTKPYPNANWFCFATWATATLNADIRNDDAPYRSERMVPLGLRRQVTPMVLKIKTANRQRYNQLLTWYQRLVFLNTTFAYAELRRRDGADNRPFAWIDNGEIATADEDGQWMQDVLQLARPVGYESTLQENRHLKPVAMAFEYYRRARSITRYLDKAGKDLSPADDDYYACLRARLIFFGNLILTAVEQDIVQPGVERVLNNVPDATTEVVSNHLSDLAERMLGAPRLLAGVRLPVKLEPAHDTFRELWVRMLTHELLVLALPGEVLRLGRDVPPRAAGLPYFPSELWDFMQFETRLEQGDDEPYPQNYRMHREDNDALANTVRAFDRSRGNGHGTAARDWRRYAERMNWATTMVRSRIQDPTLLWPPFRTEDAERIYDGRLPYHSGNPTDFDVLGPLEGFPYLSGGGTAPVFTERRQPAAQ